MLFVLAIPELATGLPGPGEPVDFLPALNSEMLLERSLGYDNGFTVVEYVLEDVTRTNLDKLRNRHGAEKIVGKPFLVDGSNLDVLDPGKLHRPTQGNQNVTDLTETSVLVELGVQFGFGELHILGDGVVFPFQLLLLGHIDELVEGFLAELDVLSHHQLAGFVGFGVVSFHFNIVLMVHFVLHLHYSKRYATTETFLMLEHIYLRNVLDFTFLKRTLLFICAVTRMEGMTLNNSLLRSNKEILKLFRNQ